MKVKQNQIIAVVQGKKSRAQKLLTESHRGWNKEAISGISKVYTSKTEGGDILPPESKMIHLDVSKKINDTMEQVASFIDAVITQETGNTKASADVEIDEKTFLSKMPVTTLLFLDKQLVDLHTYASNLPVLPPDREWKRDDNKDCYVTDVIKSIRTQKVPKPIVKYEATAEHPAQTELFSEDVTVGTWETIYMSSAIPSRRKSDILHRIETLQDAVKIAREAANSIEVEQIHCGSKILTYIFGD